MRRAAWASLLVACSTPAPIDASACDPPHAEPAQVAPDGVGYCCPRDPEPDCHCPLVGGWTSDPCLCAGIGVLGIGAGLCDVDRRDWVETTFEHGCPGWRFDGTGRCACGCDAGGG